jgi:RNA polymerase sigma factor (sigma-70 family)
MNTDWDLLRHYAEQKSDDAFSELLKRHVDLVYSAALRQVRSRQLAEEICQSVFIDLARNAPRLNANTVLTAWLYKVTRRTAVDVIRRESRRHIRECVAAELNDMNSTGSEWLQIEPLLEEAMDSLHETDRSAILLRYFENKNLREVGKSLGSSEDAAQKRVSRAVEQLRQFLCKRGVTVGASGLTVAISTNAIHAAPFGLALTISNALVLSATAIHTSTIIAASKAIAMTTTQKILIGAAFTAAIGTGIYQTQQNSKLRREIQSLHLKRTEQNQQWERDRDEISNALARSERENAGLSNKLAKLQNAKLGTNTSIAQQNPNPSEESKRLAAVVLPKSGWSDAGFSTPLKTLQTRGWAVLNADRDRFKESLLVTDGARKMLEDMFIQMAEASNDPNKAQYIQQVLDHKLTVEDGILMPMVAENRDREYTGY